MAGKPKRARSERRAQDRSLRKDVRDREKLAAMAPGGSADSAIVVTTSSLVEVLARATPCAQCGGTLDLEAHAATPGTPDLRVARMICRLCHTRRTLWYRVQTPRAN